MKALVDAPSRSLLRDCETDGSSAAPTFTYIESAPGVHVLEAPDRADAVLLAAVAVRHRGLARVQGVSEVVQHELGPVGGQEVLVTCLDVQIMVDVCF